MNALRNALIVSLVLLVATPAGVCRADDSFPDRVDWRQAKDMTDLWKGYDSRRDPLETRVVREWREGDITLRYVVFTIGTFRGQKSRLAAWYGFPKSDRKLPGLMHLHGGGQRAFVEEARMSAKHGFVGLSINYGGEPMEGQKPGDPNTDWGAITQSFFDPKNKDKLFDPERQSPRNDFWFIIRIAALRGPTFLEAQAEVDPARIGVHGHSVGGRMTTEAAADPRVKVAVPSCGGSGHSAGMVASIPGSGQTPLDPQSLKLKDCTAYLPGVRCPILNCTPTNDFAGGLDPMMENWRHIGSKQVWFSVTPHRNHHNSPETDVCKWLMYEQFLNGAYAMPATPELRVDLKQPDGIPRVSVTPDASKPIHKVDIYYSTDPHFNTRFWRDGQAQRQGDTWTAACPVMSVDQPFYALANITYGVGDEALAKKYGQPEFLLTSWEAIIKAEELKAAGVKATDPASSLVIDDFSRGMQDWGVDGRGNGQAKWDYAETRKIKDAKWRGDFGRDLLLDAKTDHDNEVVWHFIFSNWGAYDGVPQSQYFAVRQVKGSPDWQTIRISRRDMVPARLTDSPFPLSWAYLCELDICRPWGYQVVRDGKVVDVPGRGWKGTRELRNLRWELVERDVPLLTQPCVEGRYYLATHLADLFTSGWQSKDNLQCNDKPISIGKKVYERGIGTHAPAEGRFYLGGQCVSFHAEAGASAQGGSVSFEVWADGQKRFDSGLMKGGQEARAIDIALDGVKMLRLVVTDGGDGKGGDAANWANAYVVAKPDAASRPAGPAATLPAGATTRPAVTTRPASAIGGYVGRQSREFQDAVTESVQREKREEQQRKAGG